MSDKLNAKCINEPRGDGGLEGYQLNEVYSAQLCELNDKRYFRVWPGDEASPGYYETCSPMRFKKHFKLEDY